MTWLDRGINKTPRFDIPRNSILLDNTGVDSSVFRAGPDVYHRYLSPNFHGVLPFSQLLLYYEIVNQAADLCDEKPHMGHIEIPGKPPIGLELRINRINEIGLDSEDVPLSQSAYIPGPNYDNFEYNAPRNVDELTPAEREALLEFQATYRGYPRVKPFLDFLDEKIRGLNQTLKVQGIGFMPTENAKPRVRKDEHGFVLVSIATDICDDVSKLKRVEVF